MNVIDHRPPLKRIDFGSRPRAPEPPETPAGLTLRTIEELTARLEQERVWRTVVRASQGQGSVAE